MSPPRLNSMSVYVTLLVQLWVSLQVQVLSDTCDEDLRELREEVEGVLLWSNRSSASFRLDVLSCDSEPESWLWKNKKIPKI